MDQTAEADGPMTCLVDVPPKAVAKFEATRSIGHPRSEYSHISWSILAGKSTLKK
jgi:hypothetical protein